MDFPRGRGSSGKIVEFPGGGGSTARPSGMENPGGWGVKLEKPSVGGYGYFLEPHNADSPISKLKNFHLKQFSCRTSLCFTVQETQGENLFGATDSITGPLLYTSLPFKVFKDLFLKTIQ